MYRDLQPHNVLFDEWGTAHLVDFDTAVSLDDHDMSDLSHRPVIGYMAPELIEGGDADERADLYSLGATIYEMCEGHPPFAGTLEQILAARPAGPPSLERDDVPTGLRDLVLCLLALEREERPSSAAEVMSSLDVLRAARANLDRLLTSNLGTALKATLEAYLRTDSGALMQSPSSVNLPDDHRYLMQAIIALAEPDYRRAVIDACTAAEMALSLAIDDRMREKNYSPRFISETIRDANGLDGLFARYSSLCPGRKLPVSRSDVSDGLGKLRNAATHKGRVPSREKATRAVELTRALVSATHPFNR